VRAAPQQNSVDCLFTGHVRSYVGCLRGILLGTFVAFIGSLLVSCNGPPACADQIGKWKDPCPPGPNLTEFCESSMSCKEDTAPASCQASGCRVDRGRVLSIPMDSFTIAAPVSDLIVSGVNGGCADGTANAVLQASLDGVPGVHFEYLNAYDGFRWDPFPSSPKRLDIVYSNNDAPSCFTAGFGFVDSACESANQPPPCPLDERDHVELDVQSELYQGKPSLRVKWVNTPRRSRSNKRSMLGRRPPRLAGSRAMRSAMPRRTACSRARRLVWSTTFRSEAGILKGDLRARTGAEALARHVSSGDVGG
jgi:hypothetical protein